MVDIPQKEDKTRHDWAEKMIHWESCKRLKFDHSTKWYVDKSESVTENGTHSILWEKNTDHPILARQPDQVITNQKKWTSHIVE